MLFRSVEGGLDGFNRFEVAKCAAAPANGTGGFGHDCGTPALPNGTVTDFAVLAKLAGPLSADVSTAWTALRRRLPNSWASSTASP